MRSSAIGGFGAAVLAAAGLAALLPLGAAARAAGGPDTPSVTQYVTLFAGTSVSERAAARHAIETAGGHLVRENDDIGTALVTSARAGFATLVRRSGAVVGAAPNQVIGHDPALLPTRDLVERLSPADRAAATMRFAVTTHRAAATPGAEPLAGRQWDMQMIGATAGGSYAAEPGDPRVLVGVIDTGIDGSHPDIAPNFDAELSRNFTTDIPAADGPCEVPSCQDPANVDDNGHGTHVAGIIGAALNGLGIAGVAPDVTLVNVRAGQDSGFFFLQSVLDALTYSGDAGLDVVNMSFYVDPWLYNCAANPADTPEQQAQQQTAVQAVQRALDYARAKGVTLVSALGNESTDLGHPRTDTKSPNFPEGSAHDRTVDNSCLSVPAESDGVISVSALGPSGRKAYYSNYGIEQTDVSAPGGDAFDTPDFTVDPKAQILSAYPAALARANGDIDAAGDPTSPFVVKDCLQTVCGYYQYLQGTSMAAPHVTGVAALIVSKLGHPRANGFGLDPAVTEAALNATVTPHPCPTPAAYDYTVDGASGTRRFTHVCEAGDAGNGFYGKAIVNAAAVGNLPAVGRLTQPQTPTPVSPEHPSAPEPSTTPPAAPSPDATPEPPQA